jgi:serine/threonine protein kinase
MRGDVAALASPRHGEPPAVTLRFAQSHDSLPCPYCDDLHREDVTACPTAGEAILLDDKYRLKRLLGEGSFGLVWDARNVDTQKEVAIKTLRAEVASDPVVLARFFWEATAAGRVHNPHVCDVLDLVKHSAHGPYIVLERLTGRSFDVVLDAYGQLAAEKLVAMLRQVLVGLDAVHRAGIVHRDLKPENIFLHESSDGQTTIKLLDFGISKFSRPSSGSTGTAADIFMGTPAYTSPEQARGAAAVDLRTDIWAVGVMLYRALTGALPFDGPDIPSILTAILHTPHRPVTELAPDVSPALAAVVDRCLAKDREDRFQSCAELSAMLEPFERLHDERAAGVASRPFAAADSSVPFERTALASGAEVPTFRTGAAGAEVAGSYADGDLVVLGHHPSDRRWLDLFKRHLNLRTWDAGEQDPGRQRDAALAAAFRRARAVVLLVSPRFMAEAYAPGSQLYALTLMAHASGLPILWAAVGEAVDADSELGFFKALGDPSRPLERLPSGEAGRAVEALCAEIVASIGAELSAPHGPGDGDRERELRLEQARGRRARMEALGEDTRAVVEEINGLRDALRSHGPLRSGDILGDRFVVREQLGAGGFATVWRATDQKTGAAVAIKVLHAQHVHVAERRERFFRGARIMAQLDHPNIVKIIEPWASDGEFEYFVMQFVAGGTLRDTVLAGAMSTGRRVDALLAVSSALASAHQRGIIHRDIKPSNILIANDGTPYLADFDLVRAEDATGGTAGGLGTVIYAAPEMMERAADADARADVYGLGMTLAFAFYERDLTMEVIRNTDRMIGELRTSEAIRMVIRTAITWNREHRFRSADEFHSALQAAVTRRDGGAPTLRPAAPSRPAATAIEQVSLDTPVSGPVPAASAFSPTAFTGAAPSAAMLARTAFAGSPETTVAKPPLRAAFAPRRGAQEPAPAATAPPVPVAAAADEPRQSEPEEPLSLARRFAAHANDAGILVDKAVSEVFAALEVHDDSDPPAPPKAALVAPPRDDQTQMDTSRGLSTRAAPITIGVTLVLILVYLLAT